MFFLDQTYLCVIRHVCPDTVLALYEAGGEQGSGPLRLLRGGVPPGMPLVRPTLHCSAFLVAPGQSPPARCHHPAGPSETLPGVGGGGSDGPHHAGPLRTRGPGRACGWGPPSVPLLSCSPGLERLESLKYTKLGGPKSWKLRKPPVLRAPPSGGLCGADPINICNSPPCALCSLNYCPAASPRARNLWSWWGWPLVSMVFIVIPVHM